MTESAETDGPWLPDGRGLDPYSSDLVAERDLRVHLRLTSPSAGRYPRGACGSALGELWTGLTAEVTCPACLEVVHA